VIVKKVITMMVKIIQTVYNVSIIAGLVYREIYVLLVKGFREEYSKEGNVYVIKVILRFKEVFRLIVLDVIISVNLVQMGLFALSATVFKEINF
jgi:hypothetical protein